MVSCGLEFECFNCILPGETSESMFENKHQYKCSVYFDPDKEKGTREFTWFNVNEIVDCRLTKILKTLVSFCVKCPLNSRSWRLDDD
jgi:hypothetical protein